MFAISYGKLMNKRRGFAPALLVLVGFAFVFMSMAGMLLTGMSMGMAGETNGDMQGNMQGCPFMLGTSICHMSLFEHIATWQTMFMAIENVSILLLAALSSLVFACFVCKHFYPPPKLFSSYALAIAKRRSLRFVSTLLLAFSGGILNPKLF